MVHWFFVLAIMFSHPCSKNLEQEWEEEMMRLERERLMELEKQKDDLTIESDAALQNLEQVCLQPGAGTMRASAVAGSTPLMYFQ